MWILRALAALLFLLAPAGARQTTGEVTAEGLAAIPGAYRRLPVENGWHEGSIVHEDGARFRWTNAAGVSWTLTLDPWGDTLATGPTNPYRDDGRAVFELVKSAERVQGFRFGDDLYVRDGVKLVGQQSGGLKGYISAYLESAPDGFGYGVSFYVSVWSLLDRPLAGFQIGLPSTWIIPDNKGFDQPLCPPGTVARDSWPERGPTWADVFQTIEGGLGFWVSTRFPSAVPKYRMNGTPNGYNHEISSPGWGFGRIEALKPAETGIAQLSNRLLVPPDGLTFERDETGGVLGNAWMALPLVPAQVVDGTPTGDRCWTLFLSSASFRGPVAFWVPDTWSRLSRSYAAIHGRGLDARPGLMHGGAMEVNTVPFFTGADESGAAYSRIPRIRFPVDEEGRTFLMQDVTLYSHEGLYDEIARWLAHRGKLAGRFASEGAFRPKLRSSPLSLRQGREDLPLTGFEELVETTIYETPGSQAFGLRWKETPGRGQLPEYWKRAEDRLVPVAAADVPAETALLDQAFAVPRRYPSYEPPSEPTSQLTNEPAQAWSVADPRLGPFTADLTDGSRVTYAWFRFVDQPVLRDVAWTQKTRDDLQALVEEIHRGWAIDGSYLPEPSRGELAALDAAQLVTPPKGFEVGYVPIALAQRKGEDR